MHRDSQRVQDRFESAQSNGISIQEKSVTINEIVQHISDSGTCIVLTNANLLSCETCSYFTLCGNGENARTSSCLLLRTCGGNAYQGHYVLGKENQMRSPDLEFHLKIEFLIWTDLETLNQLSFEAKVEKTIKI